MSDAIFTQVGDPYERGRPQLSPAGLHAAQGEQARPLRQQPETLADG